MAGSERHGFLRTTMSGGLLFLIPVIAIIAILEKAFSLLDKVTVPLARVWGLNQVGGVRASRLLAAGVLVLICFLAGLVARTRLARRLVGWLEASLLSKLPGYSILKTMVESLTGMDEDGAVVLVKVRDDTWQIGFRMDALQDGQIVVFVPAAPGARSGSVFFMTPDRIRPLDMPMAEAITCLRRLGKGSSALVRS